MLLLLFEFSRFRFPQIFNLTLHLQRVFSSKLFNIAAFKTLETFTSSNFFLNLHSKQLRKSRFSSTIGGSFSLAWGSLDSFLGQVAVFNRVRVQLKKLHKVNFLLGFSDFSFSSWLYRRLTSVSSSQDMIFLYLILLVLSFAQKQKLKILQEVDTLSKIRGISIKVVASETTTRSSMLLVIIFCSSGSYKSAVFVLWKI